MFERQDSTAEEPVQEEQSRWQSHDDVQKEPATCSAICLPGIDCPHQNLRNLSHSNPSLPFPPHCVCAAVLAIGPQPSGFPTERPQNFSCSVSRLTLMLAARQYTCTGRERWATRSPTRHLPSPSFADENACSREQQKKTRFHLLTEELNSRESELVFF